MRNRFPSTVLGWVHLIWMVLSGIVIIYMLALITLKFSYDQKWDFLAFIGSIIGGIITLVGVQKTIKHTEGLVKKERAEKELEGALKKTRILNNISSGLTEIHNGLLSDSFTIGMHKKEENIQDWVRSTNKQSKLVALKQLVENSIDVDATTYRTLSRLEKYLQSVVDRDHVSWNMLFTGALVVNRNIEDYLNNLHLLCKKIIETRNEMDERRTHYIKLLFPNDDPMMFERL